MSLTPISSRSAVRDVLLPGTPVRARELTWEVVHAEPAGEQLRYRLRCTQGDLRGREIDLLAPFEKIEPVMRALDPKRAGRVQEWLLYHQAFLLEQELGPTAILAVQPGRLNIAPYQLVPVMKALALPRPRLLLADGVGLGKTIEAGLIIAELIARRRAHRVLILSPAGPLLKQWQDELRHRFGLRFEAIRDWETLQERRRQLVLGANPFDHVGHCLLSIEFARQEKVLLDLERATWDLVIIDEAHHCARLGGAGEGEDSRRRKLAEVLSRQSDGLLLLTATPHDGYDEHFASLLELLDPSLLDGRGSIRGQVYQRHVVRRLKHHLKKPGTAEPMFRERIVKPRPVKFDDTTAPEFSILQKALLALVAPRLRTAIKRRKFGDVLAFISLLKRSVSTVRACQSTLEVIADRYGELLEGGDEQEEARKQRLRTLSDYRRRLERYGALSAEEEADQALLEAEDMASHLRRGDEGELTQVSALLRDLRLEGRRSKREQKAHDETHQALRQLVLLAEAADAGDPKPAGLIAELQAIRAEEQRANVLVYTEYVDSQIAAVEAIARAIESGALKGEVLTIQGEDPEKVRTKYIERFTKEDGLVLVSTDATAEGLNLHERCHHLVHLELPYNPNRLEQRNGRIDRYGQEHEPIVRYLYLPGTFEERVLLRLVAKYEKQRARLTFVPNTLGLVVRDEGNMTAKLLDGLADEQSRLFKREVASERLFDEKNTEADDLSSDAYRELLADLDRAISGFERAAKSHAWLGADGLSAGESAVSAATAARAAGERLGGLDLMHFVRRAVESDARSKAAVTEPETQVVALQLPVTWVHGLDGVPGYDAGTRQMLLTSDPAIVSTTGGESVGFLGRAHPLVRRALDRVRNIAVADRAQPLDRRVTAVAGAECAMLFTYLCSVRSEAGREYERVLAVRVTPDGDPEVLTEADRWLDDVEKSKPVATQGLWERQFQRWAEGREEQCRLAAASVFEELAQKFGSELSRELALERLDLGQWLQARTEELCGKRQAPLTGARQLSLGEEFRADAQLELTRAAWQTAKDPIERLGSLKADATQTPQRRQEADGVLQLHHKRMARLARRANLETMPPSTLGLLLVAPEGKS